MIVIAAFAAVAIAGSRLDPDATPAQTAASASTTSTPTASSTARTTTAPRSTTTTTNPATTASTTPAPTTITTPARGTFTPASVAGGAGSVTFGNAPYLDFSVAAEDASGIDPDALAAIVDAILADRRSWIGDGVTGLRRVPSGGTFTLVVALPDTVDELCAPLRTNGIFSCGRNGWIALNLLRWETATEGWPADLATYRRYLVNHEVGHYLLGPGHDPCPEVGAPAPIMMQQTKGLEGCVANGWVYP